MLINLGVDLGYSYIKGKSKLAEKKFDAYIKEITEYEAIDIASSIKEVDENNLLIKYENRYFVVGRIAIVRYPSLNKKITVQREEILTKVLYIACMGLLCDAVDFDVNLAVGTPNRSRADKAILGQMLKTVYNYTYLTSEEELHKTIRVKEIFVMPQPVACAFTLSYEDCNKYNLIVIDVGYGTTDTMYLSAGLVASNEVGLRYHTRGLERCYKIIREKLLMSDVCKKVNITHITERQLQIIIESGKYFINNIEQDIKAILETSLIEFADNLFDDIESNYHILPQADVILASGGIFANVFFTKYLASKFKNRYDVMFATEKANPQMTVCHGLYNFANERFEDDFKLIDEQE